MIWSSDTAELCSLHSRDAVEQHGGDDPHNKGDDSSNGFNGEPTHPPESRSSRDHSRDVHGGQWPPLVFHNQSLLCDTEALKRDSVFLA